MQTATAFLLSDSPFFGLRDAPPDRDFACDVPATWRVRRGEEWTEYEPPGHDTPAQGWKIHVSATTDCADQVVLRTAEVAVRHGVVFKHLSTHRRFLRRNSKLCAREHAGKFVALYPPGAAVGSVLEDLEEALRGATGPYVLSDRRWREAPIYLRFGAFRPVMVDGKSHYGLIDDRGRPVQDSRSLSFSVPDWAPVPPGLRAWVERTEGAGAGGAALPFTVRQAVKFSNSGGTYLGTYEEQPVLIKEARPGAGLDPRGRDAVERLRHEYDVLRSLDGTVGVPKAIDLRRHWENDFLLEQVVPGIPLHHWASQRSAFRLRDADAGRRWLRAVRTVLENLCDVVREVHLRGYAHQDLHPANILVDPDDETVHLIDFENAVAAQADPYEQVMAAPGYGLPGPHDPLTYDAHALRQIAGFLLWPSVAESQLDPHRGDHVLRVLRRRRILAGLPVDDPDVTAVLAIADRLADVARGRVGAERGPGTLRPAPNPAGGWEAALVRGVDRARRRHGRGFPVHVDALTHGWTGLGYGPHALGRVLGDDVAPPERPRDDAPLGLINGLAGDLLASGADLDASTLQRLLAVRGRRVFDGLPGVLLALAAHPDVQRDRNRRSTVLGMVETVARAYLHEPQAFAPLDARPRARGNRPGDFDCGLLYGHLGLAWLFGRHLRESDGVVERACRRALECELSAYRPTEDGLSLQLSQGTRTLPYLATGSAGFGVVLPGIPTTVWPGRLEDELDRLARACDVDGCVFPGLFNGYAGLLLGAAGLAQARRVRDGDTSPRPPAPRVQEDVLELFAFELDDGAVVQGDGGGRITVDLATGGAGVALALAGLRRGTYDLIDLLQEPDSGKPLDDVRQEPTS